MFPAKVCNRRCSRLSRVPSPTCPHREGASILTRISFRSTPPISSLSVVEPLKGWIKSSSSAWAATRQWGSGVPPLKMKNQESILTHLIPDDLLKYGLIPEFVGRLPVPVSLD